MTEIYQGWMSDEVLRTVLVHLGLGDLDETEQIILEHRVQHKSLPKRLKGSRFKPNPISVQTIISSIEGRRSPKLGGANASIENDNNFYKG